jgi:hypothetical protein
VERVSIERREWRRERKKKREREIWRARERAREASNPVYEQAFIEKKPPM